jgi:hypothetical protein
MKKVHELLAEKRYFVGRLEELALMTEHLSQKSESWGIVHLHGPSGIGKTALLQQFALIHEPIPSVYIHANPAFPDPEHFEQAVRRKLAPWLPFQPVDRIMEGSLADALNTLAMKNGGLILLLDGLSEWSGIEQWLREEWLVSLTTNVRVFSAGRQPLVRWQTHDSWAHLIRHIPVGPLTKSEWMQFALQQGITDHKTIDLIGRVTEGVPLAINLVCNEIRSQGGKWNPEMEPRSILDLFDRVILHPDNLSGVNRLLLDLASLVYTFDHEMLEYIWGQSIPTEVFQQLCQSSFVRVHPKGGWTVSNGIRRWAKEGLKKRAPEAYKRFKYRAEQILERRVDTLAPSGRLLPQVLSSGKVFLYDNEVIQGFIYYDDEQRLLDRPARRADIPMLQDMYLRHIVAYPENLPDTSHQEQYLPEIWEMEPSVIHVFEREGRLAGFYAALPLDHPALREILNRNPATRAFVACTPPEPCDWLYWLIASDPPLDPGFSGQIVREMLQHKLPGNRITMMMPSVEFTEAARLAGFREVPAAFYPSSDGCNFYFFQLDARGHNRQDPSIATADPKIWMEITKKLLASYTRLETQTSVLQQCQRMWGTNHSQEQLAKYVQQTILGEWRRLRQGTPKEQKLAQILYYAFMHKVGTHEIVAERLGLPSSTYYRHLGKLIRELARSLQFYRGIS